MMKILIYVIRTLGIFFCFTVLLQLLQDGGNSSSCQYQPLSNTRVNYSNQSIALSPPLLRKLAEADEIIYKVVKDESENNAEGDNCYRQAMTRYLKHFDMTTGNLILHFHDDRKVPHRPMNVAWNPLATYHLLNRFHTILKPLLVVAFNESDQLQHAVTRKIFSVMSDLGWTTEDDLHSGISSILRIQHFYDLSTTDLSEGKIREREYGISMSSDDCIAIGKQALSESYLDLAVEWFEQARSTMKDSGPKQEVVEEYIQLARSIHDREFDKSTPTNVSFFRQKLSKEPGNRERRRTYFYKDVEASLRMKFYDAIYWSLCEGEHLMTPAEEARLFCYYETKVNPAFSISPLKVEILSLNPLLVVQYHDILSESRMERLKSEASGRLKRSTTRRFDDSAKIAPGRTSTNANINDKVPEYSYIPLVARLITGLIGGSGPWDRLQVNAYSAGSHYGPHTDARSWSAIEAAGVTERALVFYRIATFVFYLSDVIEGGATVFPRSGLTVTPVKGSAIFWYNLQSSGELDPRTLHSSCPVIIGEKWIANKWIRGIHQVVNPQYRCGKDVNDLFGMRINGWPIDEL